MTTQAQPALKLSALSQGETEKWFFLARNAGGVLDLCDEKDAELSLHVKYHSPEEITNICDQKLTRRALAKGGVKGLVANQDKNKRTVTRRALLGWKMTLRGALAIGLRRSVGHMALDSEVPYNEENLKVMLADSQLAETVFTLTQDFHAWFGVQLDADDAPDVDDEDDDEEDEGERGNLQSSNAGQSGSGGESPAPPASTTT